ncbi:MAG: glycoside hydrolase family 16 protein [Salinimicrobium sp.]
MKCFKNAIFGTLLIAAFPQLLQAQVIFQEDFEGEQLDLSHWNYEEGDGCPNLCGWGNEERQTYDRDYVEVKDGNLVITAAKEGDKYFSGRITTKDKVEFQYGEIEIRAKLPEGHGLWPAFWMLGADIAEVGWPQSGEIDILEYVGREPNILYTSLHYPAHHGGNATSKKTFLPDIEEGYHTYKAHWTKKEISFYYDGQKVFTFIPETYDEVHYPYQKPFYILVNMAIGGNFGGPEVDDSIFPAKYYIDYIKVTEIEDKDE